MTATNLVIVESPAKAKTINKYLGKDFKVIASIGHVRDLPPKDGSVRPDEDFAMDWQVSDRAKKQLSEIIKLAKSAKTVYLATDPDREGEAISWHLAEILKEKKLLGKIELKRVAFNEITKSAVAEAFKQARGIDNHLVEAYLARRALDYLVGFTLSPILWRKLPGSRSAGRVQSVALRLICEREREIEIFKSDEYWSIETEVANQNLEIFKAKLSQINGKKLKKLDIKNAAQAKEMSNYIQENKNSLYVKTVEKKQIKRNPPPAFITSTLQQEASRKLGFGATRTMRIAQKLYEGVDIGGETVGLITYMRTDGTNLSQDAITDIRKVISNKFGKDYLPNSPRFYKSKAKNAQEAHEAIRPTNASRIPNDIAKYLEEDELKLYKLIWQRTVACQMQNALLNRMTVDITNDKNDIIMRATGTSIAFNGYFAVYREGKDDSTDDGSSDDENMLPDLNEGEKISLKDIKEEQHFTQPPPRYTEASLVKKMEELGIGRPSTYASIMQVLRDRNYVTLDKKRFVAENRGRVVTSFLANFFQKYVEYDFTAKLEEQLDDITAGSVNWKNMLKEFWADFSKAVEDTKDLRITEVIDVLDKELEHILFPIDEKNPDKDPRKCPKCEDGRLGLKLGKFGGFVGCSNYPKCKYTKPFVSADGNDSDDNSNAGEPKELGLHPDTNMPVTLRLGPYGHYVQLEVAEIKEEEKKPKKTKSKTKTKPKKKKTPKPKRMSIPRGMAIDSIDLDIAVKLLSLPREVGKHPETGEIIKAGIGRFGPYLVYQGKFKSLPKGEPDLVLTIGLKRAVEILAQPSGKGGFGELKKLGEHPKDGKPVTLNRGRFGPYIKYAKINATIPKDMDIEKITLAQALELLEKKAKNSKSKSKKTARQKK